MVLVLVLLQLFCASAGQLSGSRVNDGSPGSGTGVTSHAGTRESTGSGASGSSSSSAFLFGANKPSAVSNSGLIVCGLDGTLYPHPTKHDGNVSPALRLIRVTFNLHVLITSRCKTANWKR